jgi:lipid II isoglutaminyl synthase (glutamine-hydrolysing)
LYVSGQTQKKRWYAVEKQRKSHSIVKQKLALVLAHLYPEQMNIYGDRGNITTIVQRTRWRNIALEVQPIAVGDTVDWSRFDMAFFGGGQDSGQSLIVKDLMEQHAPGLSQAIENGLVMLAICGGYQLLGHYFLTHTGERLPGIGVLDIYTIGGKKRMIGNTVIRTSLLERTSYESERLNHHRLHYLVGFENHSGRTYHGNHVAPLGQIVTGYGDNGEDGVSGAVYRNTIGCYLHGALLPKNPHLADHLILLALRRRYGLTRTLPPLNDTLELQAHRTMIERLVKE